MLTPPYSKFRFSDRDKDPREHRLNRLRSLTTSRPRTAALPSMLLLKHGSAPSGTRCAGERSNDYAEPGECYWLRMRRDCSTVGAGTGRDEVAVTVFKWLGLVSNVPFGVFSGSSLFLSGFRHWLRALSLCGKMDGWVVSLMQFESCFCVPYRPSVHLFHIFVKSTFHPGSRTRSAHIDKQYRVVQTRRSKR